MGLRYVGQMNGPWEYQLRPKRVAAVLACIAAVLLALHLVAMQANFNESLGLKERFGFHYWQLAMFDLDEEESFGTWFSSGLLLAAGILLIHIARATRGEPGNWDRWWLALGLGFCVLSIDEAVGVHELVNTMMDETSWTVLAFPILGAVLIAYVPFLWHYRGPMAVAFLIAGAIYTGGAVGVEHFTDAQVNSLHYNMWTALEEGMEMGGVIWFIYALLDFMRGASGRAVQLVVGTAADPSAAGSEPRT